MDGVRPGVRQQHVPLARPGHPRPHGRGGAEHAGRVLSTATTLLVFLPGCAVAVLGTYLVVLALASFGRDRAPAGFGDASHPRLAVLVPAHDEELLVGRCVHSLLDQTYPAGSYEVFVIADNCSDGTAAVAEAAGARVLVRTEPSSRGKGRALRWA